MGAGQSGGRGPKNLLGRMAGLVIPSAPDARKTVMLSPIDLARHPKAGEWPEHRRHDYATEWLLHTLERGQPYDVTQWPSPPMDRARPESLKDLEPIEVVTSDTPRRGARLVFLITCL